MLRLSCFCFLFAVSGSVSAQSELDQAFFGLEFRDGRDAVQISWIDDSNRTTKKLNVGDVVLKAGDIVFANAEELSVALKQQPVDKSIRFEVLALSDEKPRKILVKPETLRESVIKRFDKDRDRDAQHTLLAPKLKAESLFIAIAQDFDGKLLGLRLIHYPKSATLKDDGTLLFEWSVATLRSESVGITWTPKNVNFPGLSEADIAKFPTLTASQLRSVRIQAHLEFDVDQTEYILRILESTRRQPFRVGGVISYSRKSSTENEQRNFESALLLYKILSEKSADVAE